MKQEATLIRARLKTPRAAAIAGILFSVLLVTGLLLFRLSVRADPLETGAWLKTRSNTVALALNLVPFAGIAFLWFIGVLRDRLGELEDRFFATVFLGSGLLFLAMLFASAAVAGGIIIAYAARPEGLLDSPTFTFARAVTYDHESLRGQDGSAIHDLDVHTRDPNRYHPALDCVPRLRVRAVSPAQRALYRVDFTGLPVVGALDQHLYPNR
jgi:hypothetical protein